MKFGHNLVRNQVPEWTSNYINYKGLKKLIKSAAISAEEADKGVDLAEFFYYLDRNLETVDNFYNKKFNEATRRLKLLDERYGKSKPSGLDTDEVEELQAALLELRGQFRKLQWFGEVNRRGFVKITKKADKKLPNTSVQQAYNTSKVDPRPFASTVALTASMKIVNDWLLALGEASSESDAQSVHSVHSLKRVSSASNINFSAEVLALGDSAMRDDNASSLAEFLRHASLDDDNPSRQKLQIKLLHRAISLKAKRCIELLLTQTESLYEEDDINLRNCIHRLVISIGRSKSNNAVDVKDLSVSSSAAVDSKFITPATHPLPIPKRSTCAEPLLMKLEDEPVALLKFVLLRLTPSQRAALLAKDTYGRLPLHYGAQYGIVVVCELIMSFMREWDQFNIENGIDAPEWQDKEGFAPLHLSVIGGHPLTTKALLRAENWQCNNGDRMIAIRKSIPKSSAVLALATKANYSIIVELLVQAGVDVNWQDDTGETALHVAARFGTTNCAKILIAGHDNSSTNLEIIENSFGWTALHIAAVDGHLDIVELLVNAGANVDVIDSSGWTAKEHAALRGHLDVAYLLDKVMSPIPSMSEDNSRCASEVKSLGERRSQLPEGNHARPSKTIKTFGHRYLTDKTMILVSLGSMDQRKDIRAVELDKIPMTDAHLTQLDTALSLVVTAIGAEGQDESTIIDLPVHDNISTEPIAFMTNDPTKVKLLFDIVPTYSGNEKQKLGRGVALLSSMKQTIGASRMNLQGDVSVPIISAAFDVIGLVNFNFLVIRPFSHPNLHISEQQTYWKSIEQSTMVIGHRGLGKNNTSNRSLQLGENTIESFIAAANLGANYVEFDVQLTKDHVPVIYHDFLVSETGIDAPVHTLTLEQFMHINSKTKSGSGTRNQSPSSSTHSSKPQLTRSNSTESRPRSFSVGHLDMGDSGMDERMKHTRDFKEKGYKPNTRGRFIQAPFTTLEQMFNEIPDSVGFNIEMKYPMLFETEEHEMDTYAIELNSFCDTILTKVYDMGAKRNIIFSSFNPDICLLLSLKQPNYPILFLSDAGTAPVGDVRASSLQEAIRFATRWNLLGIVSAAEPLCNSPRLVKVVKDNGLVCVSYGTLNNDPIMVQQQVQEGIDAVIVDSVLAIRKGLTERAAAKINGKSSSGSASPPEVVLHEAREVELNDVHNGSAPVNAFKELRI